MICLHNLNYLPLARLQESSNQTLLLKLSQREKFHSNSMKQCLKADYSKRFNIQDGIAHFHRPLPATSEKAFLVTPQCCYPAEGIEPSSTRMLN